MVNTIEALKKYKGNTGTTNENKNTVEALQKYKDKNSVKSKTIHDSSVDAEIKAEPKRSINVIILIAKLKLTNLSMVERYYLLQ